MTQDLEAKMDTALEKAEELGSKQALIAAARWLRMKGEHELADEMLSTLG